MRRLALGFLALLPLMAAAATFEDGSAAYERGDYAGALAIWRPLAEEGDAASQSALASLYAAGTGIAQSDLEALRWFRRAAEQGDSNAQFQVGRMYSEGKGAPPSRSKAMLWFEKAAKQGHGMAQHALAWMYATGTGRDRDFVKAYAWFSVSAAHGVRTSEQKRDRAREALREQQIPAAERLAEEYIEKYGPE